MINFSEVFAHLRDLNLPPSPTFDATFKRRTRGRLYDRVRYAVLTHLNDESRREVKKIHADVWKGLAFLYVTSATVSLHAAILDSYPADSEMAQCFAPTHLTLRDLFIIQDSDDRTQGPDQTTVERVQELLIRYKNRLPNYNRCVALLDDEFAERIIESAHDYYTEFLRRREFMAQPSRTTPKKTTRLLYPPHSNENKTDMVVDAIGVSLVHSLIQHHLHRLINHHIIVKCDEAPVSAEDASTMQSEDDVVIT